MSVSAERTVLGAILVDNSSIASAIETLKPTDFESDSNGKIFSAMLNLYEQSVPIDLITVKNELTRSESLTSCGGIGYLASLTDGVPRLDNVEAWATIVKEASTLRILARTATEIGQWASDGVESSGEILDRAEAAIFAISDRREKSGPVPISDSIREAFKGIESLHESDGKISGIPSGLIDLDRITDGFQGGDLVIIAARPSVGKTSLAMNIAKNAAEKSDKTVAVFSLEMSRTQLVQRMIYSEAMIDKWMVKRGALKTSDWNKLTHAWGELNRLKICIDDTSFLTPLELRAKCRRLKASSDLGMVVIDYLQLMSAGVKRENANQDISFISRSLKGLAKELDVPVICLSQLSRSAERREDHRPQLSDLRDSGAIEQDADVVMFLYRDNMYNPQKITLQTQNL